MTASQSCKSARRARCLSTGHGRARPDIRPVVANRPTTHRVRRDPPLIHQPFHHPTGLLDRLNSNHSPHPRHPNPHSPRRATHVPLPRFPCMGLFLSRSSAEAANLLSFVSFFVRSKGPFLRPDPRFADVVARRSCQGWPSSSLAASPAWPGHALTALSTTARSMRSGRRSEGSPLSGADHRATTLYSVGPRTRTMMQSCASAAKLRSGGPILPFGEKSQGNTS